VCSGGCGEVPTRLSYLGGPGFGAVFRLLGVHGAAAVRQREVLHGGGLFDVVRWASLLTFANARPWFVRSMIVCVT
jgi:hypothetical protein